LIAGIIILPLAFLAAKYHRRNITTSVASASFRKTLGEENPAPARRRLISFGHDPANAFQARR
jgi:hypothetical protein